MSYALALLSSWPNPQYWLCKIIQLDQKRLSVASEPQATLAGRKFYIVRFTEKVCLVPNSSEMAIPQQHKVPKRAQRPSWPLFFISNVRSWPLEHFTFSLCADGNSNLTAVRWWAPWFSSASLKSR